MTTLTVEDYRLPAADVGPENPLPNFRGDQDSSIGPMDANVDEEVRRYTGWHTAFRVLPYRMQDGYSRKKTLRPLRGIVLRNEYVRATFVPELGARLASLVDLESGRELLDRNPVFQPANLALRNAWFSGGIEFNAGQPGHHYFTCSPVFAAPIRSPGGEPGVRFYEWERVKGFTWQIDVHLPAGSRFLFAHMTLVNPHPYEIPMYWWTNMAVPETPDTRVVIPADTTLGQAPSGLTGEVPLPIIGGRDVSYSTTSQYSGDSFFGLRKGDRPYVAAVRGDGTGYVQTSTDRLKGRKLFYWGMSAGGRWWQEFLAAPGSAYIEIQAGLARSQGMCIPMPADTVWNWTEAYGAIAADAGRVHGKDWPDAQRAVAESLEAALPRVDVNAAHERFAVVAKQPGGELSHRGSGWGALEGFRAESAGEPRRLPAHLAFEPCDLGTDQAPWIALMSQGALPPRPPRDDPGQAMVQPEWRKMLEEAVAAGRGDHWLSWYHLGIMRMEDRDRNGAREAWEKSLAHARTGWALRGLAVIAQREGRGHEGAELLVQALDAGPAIVPLAVECADALLREERWGEIRATIAKLPPEVRDHERLRILDAKAALSTGDLASVEGLFDHDFATIREGEVTLTDLWFDLHARKLAAAEGVPLDDALRARARRLYPAPHRIDFRMAAEG